jgi:predicted Zn-dependent protease
MCKISSRRALAPALLLACLAGCATPLSVPEERQLGFELDREVRREAILVRDEVIVGYVDRIGREIVRAAGEQPYEFHFQVIDDEEEINAFAGPAGWVYVNTSILLTARNVSELAGVIGHEIGHVVLRHVAQNYGRERSTSTLQQIGVLAAAAVGGSAAAGLANLGGGLAAMAYVNSFGREAEREADAFAVEMLPRAGYDPEGLVTFFDTLVREVGDGGMAFLSSHPATSERIRDTTALIEASPRGGDLRVDDGGQLEIIQRRIRLLDSLRRQRRGGR